MARKLAKLDAQLQRDSETFDRDPWDACFGRKKNMAFWCNSRWMLDDFGPFSWMRLDVHHLFAG